MRPLDKYLQTNLFHASRTNDFLQIGPLITMEQTKKKHLMDSILIHVIWNMEFKSIPRIFWINLADKIIGIYISLQT